MDDARFLVLAEGSFGPQTSKTANACIRYTPERVVAVLDSTKAGRTSQDVLGFGGDIPVVPTLEAGLARKPNALLVGIAPAGGQLPPEWIAWIAAGLRQGLDVWSGLHYFLGDDPMLVEAAKAGRPRSTTCAARPRTSTWPAAARAIPRRRSSSPSDRTATSAR